MRFAALLLLGACVARHRIEPARARPLPAIAEERPHTLAKCLEYARYRYEKCEFDSREREPKPSSLRRATELDADLRRCEELHRHEADVCHATDWPP